MNTIRHFCLFSGLAICTSTTVIAQVTVVSPGEFATTEAPDVADLTGVPSYRLQQVYAATDFASLGPGPYTITRVDWRPGAEMTETIDYPSEQFIMKFATTSVDPTAGGLLDATFANNIEGNEQTVFDGPVTLTTANAGPVEGPKEFDYGLPLQTDYVYDPSAGNLLMDLTVINGEGPLLLDWVAASTATTTFIWSGTLGHDSPMATDGQFGGHIAQFTVVPEPSSLGLLLPVLAAIIRLRRRKK